MKCTATTFPRLCSLYHQVTHLEQRDPYIEFTIRLFSFNKMENAKRRSVDVWISLLQMNNLRFRSTSQVFPTEAVSQNVSIQYPLDDLLILCLYMSPTYILCLLCLLRVSIVKTHLVLKNTQLYT